jgi:hypothetical protein
MALGRSRARPEVGPSDPQDSTQTGTWKRPFSMCLPEVLSDSPKNPKMAEGSSRSPPPRQPNVVGPQDNPQEESETAQVGWQNLPKMPSALLDANAFVRAVALEASPSFSGCHSLHTVAKLSAPLLPLAAHLHEGTQDSPIGAPKTP